MLYDTSGTVRQRSALRQSDHLCPYCSRVLYYQETEEQSEQLFADIESGSLSDLEDYSEEGEDDAFDEDSEERRRLVYGGLRGINLGGPRRHREVLQGPNKPSGASRRKVRAHESAAPGNSRAVVKAAKAVFTGDRQRNRK